MENLHVNDNRVLMKLCKYLASLSAYENLDTEQPLRIYTDDDGELLAFEGIIYKLVWTNNRHSLSELASVINDFEVVSFSEFRNKIYSLA